MKLKKGQKIRHFDVKDISGKKISTKKLKNKKLMVSFFRYASCPFCNLRIHELIRNHKELKKKGLSIIAFFESPKKSMEKYVGKQKPPFPIIPDPERKIYREYGIESSYKKFLKGLTQVKKFKKANKLGFKGGEKDGDIHMIPADFLIKNGRIHTAYYGKDISDHLSIKDIKNFLK